MDICYLRAQFFPDRISFSHKIWSEKLHNTVILLTQNAGI